MSLFCKHSWKLESETTTKSKFEMAMSSLPVGVSTSKLPWQLCDGDRKHVQVFSCSKCGAIKRFVESI